MATIKNSNHKTATTKYGSVQYLDIGPADGKILLFSTGGGSSFKAALAFQWMCDEGYRILSVNRPGYYDLPLHQASSIEEHADIYFEVIKSLKIEEKINVFGVSMGGLSALYYASKYPTRSLVLWSAITGKYEVNKASADSFLGKLVLNEKGKNLISWLLKVSARYFPKMTIKAFLKTEADLTQKEKNKIAKEVVNTSKSKSDFMLFIDSMTPMGAFYEGMMDEVRKAQQLKETDWSKIKCPTYAVHSTVDIDVSMDHPKRLEEMIPNLTMEYVKAGGHFVWWGKEGEKVKLHTIRFLNNVNSKNNDGTDTI